MNKKAFTLLEVLISIAIFALVMTAIYKIYSSTIKQSDIGFWRTRMNMKTSLFFEKFKSDVIQANNFVDLISSTTPEYRFAPLRYVVNEDFSHSDQIDVKNGIFVLNYDGSGSKKKATFLRFYKFNSKDLDDNMVYDLILEFPNQKSDGTFYKGGRIIYRKASFQKNGSLNGTPDSQVVLENVYEIYVEKKLELDHNNNYKYDFQDVYNDRFVIELTFVFGYSKSKEMDLSKLKDNYKKDTYLFTQTISNQVNVDVWGGKKIDSSDGRKDQRRNIDNWNLPEFTSSAMPDTYNSIPNNAKRGFEVDNVLESY